MKFKNILISIGFLLTITAGIPVASAFDFEIDEEIGQDLYLSITKDIMISELVSWSIYLKLLMKLHTKLRRMMR